MAFETPCLSEPSRNGAKSTTFTVDKLPESIVVEWVVVRLQVYRLLGSFSRRRDFLAENAESRFLSIYYEKYIFLLVLCIIFY